MIDSVLAFDFVTWVASIALTLWVIAVVETDTWRERHHAYLGLPVFFAPVPLPIRLLCLVILIDDAYHHCRHSIDARYESPLHRFYAWLFVQARGRGWVAITLAIAGGAEAQQRELPVGSRVRVTLNCDHPGRRHTTVASFCLVTGGRVSGAVISNAHSPTPRFTLDTADLRKIDRRFFPAPTPTDRARIYTVEWRDVDEIETSAGVSRVWGFVRGVVAGAAIGGSVFALCRISGVNNANSRNLTLGFASGMPAGGAIGGLIGFARGSERWRHLR